MHDNIRVLHAFQKKSKRSMETGFAQRGNLDAA
jgi:phage-related protein